MFDKEKTEIEKLLKMKSSFACMTNKTDEHKTRSRLRNEQNLIDDRFSMKKFTK